MTAFPNEPVVQPAIIETTTTTIEPAVVSPEPLQVNIEPVPAQYEVTQTPAVEEQP